MTIQEAFEQLKELKLDKSSENKVRELLKHLLIPTIPIVGHKNIVICRARCGKGYRKRSDMLYAPIKCCTRYQRATIPDNTAFYGVISDNNRRLENARYISACECSTLFRAGKQFSGRQFITVSHWEIVKPLNLLSFITDKTFPEVKDNSILNELREQFTKLYSGEENKLWREIAYFISNEFQKDVKEGQDYEYMITANLTHMIFQRGDFDGIIYPSVPAGGHAGVNIVLSVNAVHKKLRYLRLIEQIMYKHKDRAIVRMVKNTERNGRTEPVYQFTSEDVCNELGIQDVHQLPLW